MPINKHRFYRHKRSILNLKQAPSKRKHTFKQAPINATAIYFPPFALGAVLALSAIYLRRSLMETTSFTTETQSLQQRGSFKELLHYKRELGTIIGFTIGLTVSFYTFTTYLQKFLVNTAGFSKNDSTLITIIALLVFMIAQPIAGLLGDKIGRKRTMIIYGVLALVTTIPIMTLLGTTRQIWLAALLMIIVLLILSLSTSFPRSLKQNFSLFISVRLA